MAFGFSRQVITKLVKTVFGDLSNTAVALGLLVTVTGFGGGTLAGAVKTGGEIAPPGCDIETDD
jgi:hypothetical protein